MNHLFNFERLLIRFQQQPPWPRGPGEFVYGRRIAAYGHHRTLLTGEDGRQLFRSAKTSGLVIQPLDGALVVELIRRLVERSVPVVLVAERPATSSV